MAKTEFLKIFQVTNASSPHMYESSTSLVIRTFIGQSMFYYSFDQDSDSVTVVALFVFRTKELI